MCLTFYRVDQADEIVNRQPGTVITLAFQNVDRLRVSVLSFHGQVSKDARIDPHVAVHLPYQAFRHFFAEQDRVTRYSSNVTKAVSGVMTVMYGPGSKSGELM